MVKQEHADFPEHRRKKLNKKKKERREEIGRKSHLLSAVTEERECRYTAKTLDLSILLLGPSRADNLCSSIREQYLMTLLQYGF